MHRIRKAHGGKVDRWVLIIGSVIVVLFIIIVAIRGIFAQPTQTPTKLQTALLSNPVTSKVVSVATGTSTPPIVKTPAPAPVGHAIGIAAGGGLSKLSAADQNTELNEMNALGATWVRFDIEWGLVQYNSPNTSTWGSYDTLINNIQAHHLNGLAILLFTPQWARDPSCTGGAKCPPANPSQFATFAAEAVARYKGKGIHTWEIWNEENNYAFWATKTNCQAYTALLKATYPAIKKVDPTATVIIGGLAPEATDSNNISQTDFLSCVYNNGGKGYFDAVGDHPYTFPALASSNNTNTWAQMSETSPSLRSIMIANGDGNKKIWMTEYGAPTDGPDPHWFVTEAQQAAMVTDTINLYRTYSWAGPLFWYTLDDDGTSTSTQENFFGLIRFDGSLKPAFTTLQNAIKAGL